MSMGQDVSAAEQSVAAAKVYVSQCQFCRILLGQNFSEAVAGRAE
jgi:hypothetical protein